MLYFYLFSAVAGCLFIGVSVSGLGAGDSGEGHGDGQDAADGNDHALSAAPQPDQAQSGGQHASHGPAGDHGHASLLGGLSSAALFFFSVQVWTYLLAFGGLTGLLLRTLAHVGEPIAGLCALGVGLSTALGARKVLSQLAITGDSGTVQQEKLVGSTAQVLIPAGPGATGKVRLLVRGQTLDLLAKAEGGKPLVAGAEVVILDIDPRDSVAEVAAELSESPPLPRRAADRRALPENSSSTKG